eukprot:9491809-Pyramimonas_sp.AAC.1
MVRSNSMTTLECTASRAACRAPKQDMLCGLPLPSGTPHTSSSLDTWLSNSSQCKFSREGPEGLDMRDLLALAQNRDSAVDIGPDAQRHRTARRDRARREHRG